MHENDLKNALRGVRAPDGLWNAIERRLGEPAPRRRGTALATAAGIAVTLGASWLALWARATPDVVATFHQVCGHPERLETQTADIAELRRWMADRGLTLKASDSASAGIEVSGATRLAGDRIAVAYRAGGAWSALIVVPAAAGQPGKAPKRRLSAGLTVFEWGSGGHRYTLVTSLGERAEQACGICHAEPVV